MKRLFFTVVIVAIAVIIHGVLFQRLWLIDPPVHPDETFFADTARQQLLYGVPKTFLFEENGLGNQHIRNYMYPPLYTDIVSIWFRLTEISIEQTRLLSFIVSILCIISGFLVLYRFSGSLVLTFVSLLSLVTFGPFGIASRVGRMEIVALFLFFVALCITYCVKQSKRRYVVLGVCSGLLILIHPLAVILMLIITLLLLQEKSTPLLRWHYLLPIAGFLLFWLIRYSDNLPLFYHQLTIQLQYKADRIPLLDQVFQTSVYWRVFLILYLVVTMLCFLYGYIKKKNTGFLFGGILIVTILTVWRGIEQWYLVYLLPMVLLTLSLLYRQTGIVSKLLIYGVLVSLSIYQTISLKTSLQQTSIPYYQFVERLRAYTNKDAKILVSHFPDPTLGLWQKGYTNVYQLEHVTGKRSLQEYLATFDVIVVNYFTNTELKTFINQYEFVRSEMLGNNTTILYLR